MFLPFSSNFLIEPLPVKTAKKNRGLLLSAHGSLPFADGHDSVRQTFKLIKLKK
jgi:hypothetical protein